VASVTDRPVGWSARLLHRVGADPLWVACAVAAATLLLIAAFLPLWRMRLEAPQYPAGLTITAYGYRMEGDIEEVNDLNHYIGVAPIEPGSIIELDLFPAAIVGLVAVLLAGALLAQRGRLRVMVAVATWAMPIGMLADLQWWLYRVGHDLDREAPMRALVPHGFTPKVIGGTQVVNFHSSTMVGAGFWLMVAAALVISFGPQVIRFFRDSWRNTGSGSTGPRDTGPSTPGSAPKIAAAIVIAFLLASAVQRPAEAAHTRSLSALIAGAAPGSTVTVPPGTYREALVIDRPIALIGGGGVVIDGGRIGDVVQITADDVTFRGFTVRGSARDVADEPAGIRVTGSRATIEDNRLEDVLYGIAVSDGGGHAIRRNTIVSIPEFSSERRGHALYLWHTNGNIVQDNTVNTVKDGIFVGFSADNLIERNRVEQGRYGIHYMYADHNRFVDNVFRDNVAGGAIMFSRDIAFTGNEFSGNRSPASGFGLLFKDVDDVQMVDNLVHHNRIGLTMEGAPHTPGAFVTVRHNLFGFNRVGVELATTTAAVFADNTFTGNLEHVGMRGDGLERHNTWADRERGNYWDGYRGFDADSNGIGDLPFVARAAYGQLTQRNEALRAYAFTPASASLELATRWFPVFRPEPTLVDPAPLISPTIALPGDASRHASIEMLVAMSALTALPVALQAGARRRR